MLTTSTPETVNPVSDACRGCGRPCISTVVPWEAWYFGRGAKPGKPSPSSTPTTSASASSSSTRPTRTSGRRWTTNKKVGVMWPNDSDGNAIRGALGPLLKKAGYTIVDPGAYTDGTNDYSSQISKFKSANCEIFNTFPIPPDFATFWRQAAQQGYKPKIVQIAKTGLFPSQISSFGKIGVDIAAPRTGRRLTLTRPRSPRQLEGARRRATRRPAESSGTSRPARASRSSTSRPPYSGRRRPEGQGSRRERDEDAQGDDARRRAAVGQGPGRERRRDADHRRSVGQGATGKYKLDLSLRALVRPERSDRRQSRPTA